MIFDSRLRQERTGSGLSLPFLLLFSFFLLYVPWLLRELFSVSVEGLWIVLLEVVVQGRELRVERVKGDGSWSRRKMVQGVMEESSVC